MKRKLGAILLVIALALSLGLVPAASVGATTGSDVLVSSNATTETVGYIYTGCPWSPTNPLTATYSESPTWRLATDIASPHGAWYPENTGNVSGAYWVSTADGQEQNYSQDSWRLFRHTFSIPSGAVNISATLYMTADNDAIAYLDDVGTIIGELASGDVYICYHGQGGNHGTLSSFGFTPGPGSHTLYIVTRNWGWGSSNPTALLYRAVIEYDLPDIEKTMASDGYLGDIITVTLEVENPYTSATVEDVIPDGLRYILDTFMVDSGSGPVAVTPTIADNTISTTVGQGDFTITFDVQVVEVQCEEVTVTNTAELWYDGDPVASDSKDITLWPYEGFEKVATIVHEGNPNGQIEVNELVHWDMTITVPNNVGWDITDAVLKDNLGGELGMADDDVDNDREGGTDEDPVGVHAGDLSAAHNTIPSGTLSVKTPGKSNKVHFWIEDIDIGSSDPDLVFVLGIFTDYNPGKGKIPGIHSYSSPGTDYYLNSGATLKFTDTSEGGTGFLLSAHTCPILIDVVPPIPPS